MKALIILSIIFLGVKFIGNIILISVSPEKDESNVTWLLTGSTLITMFVLAVLIIQLATGVI